MFAKCPPHVRRVGEPAIRGDGGDALVGALQHPGGQAQAQVAGIGLGADAHRGLEQALQLARRQAQATRQFRQFQRLPRVLLHQQDGAAHGRRQVGGHVRRQGLDGLAVVGVVDLQDAQGFANVGGIEVALEDARGDVDRSGAAGTGDAPPVEHVQPVGDDGLGIEMGELVDEVPIVEPADAGAVAGQDAGLGQGKDAGAQADDMTLGAGGPAQVVENVGAGGLTRAPLAADDDDVVEPRRIAQQVGGHDLDAAAGSHGDQGFRHDLPGAAHGAAEVALVGRQAQDVQQAGKRGHGELRQQDEGESDGRSVHDVFILTKRVVYDALNPIKRSSPL